jgi:two-component system, NarL family, response regulator NreC
VEVLQRNRCIYSPRVSDLILRGYRRHQVDPASPTISRLSPREREILQLAAEGKTSKEVALTLNVTAKTVDTHRSNILTKLGLHSIAELVLYAVRNNIIQVQRPTVLQFPPPGNGHAEEVNQVAY